MTQGADFNRDEELMARKDGAKLVKNSGRGQNKGDAVRGNLCIDYKFTDSKSYSISEKNWRKHENDSFRAGKEPVIVSVFRMLGGLRLAIVRWDYLMGLEDELEELRAKCQAS